jgi:hypothetical protein
MNIRKKAGLLLSLCLGTTVAAYAQLDLGQIAGVVRDPTEALVANASVAARNLQTNNVVSTKTESSGLYVLVNLPIGPYEITVEAAGFKKFVRSNITVDVARRTDVDIVLEVGSAAESVTVTATAAMLAVDTAVLGGVVENRQMTDIAMNGRNPFYMAEIKPGVIGDQFNSFNPATMYTGLKINGGQGHSNAVTVDGVNFERMRGDYNSNTQLGVLNVDAIAEVQILTSTYPAEYGRAKDAQVRFVTKSGTREFHGTLFEFFRNKVLDANSWTRNSSSQAFQNSHPAPLSFNQPGLSLGGPFVIPRKFNTDRRKLFFFFSEEWMYWRAIYTTTNTVPSAAMRTGDLSELLNPANPFFGAVKTVKDPNNGVAFPNNIVPPSRVSPNGLGLLRSYPLPTPGYQIGNLNVIQSEPDPVNQWKDTTHWDYYLGRNRISFAGTYYWYEEFTPFSGSYTSTNNVTGLDRFNRYWTRPNMTGMVGFTSTITPTMMNDVSYNAGTDIVHIDVYPEEGVEKYDRRLYGINYPHIYPDSQKVLYYIIPSVSATGITSISGGAAGAKSSGPFHQVIDNFTWVGKKNHAFKFGVLIEHGNQHNGEQTTGEAGSFTFADTGLPNTTGVALGNVVLGNYNSYSESGPHISTQVTSWAVEAYAQDTWRVTPKLTLEIGVRYSKQQPWNAQWHDTTNFESAYYTAANVAVVDPATGYITSGDPYNGLVKPGAGIPTEANGRALATSLPNVQRLFHNLPLGFYDSPSNAFAPRLGIAYRMNKKTVIRTGAGLFHARDNLYGGTIGQPPDRPSFTNYYGSAENPGGAIGLSQNIPVGNSGMNVNQKYPTAFARSLSVQRELPGTIVLDIAYVGKTGMNLGRSRALNQLPLGTITRNPTVQPNAMRPYLGLASLNQYATEGHSSYNSLQATLERRFAAGFGFGAAFTWSKNIDSITTPYNANQFQRAISVNNYPMNLMLNYIYELPFLRHSNSMAGKVLSGWQVSGVTVYRSGDPLSVTDGTDMAGVSGGGAQVWNCVGSPSYSGPIGVGLPYFNKAAFSMPAAGTWGNCGYNILRGPHFDNWDLALFKGFSLVERVRAEFRAELFDFPNHPILQNPGTNPRSGSFGVITQKGDERNIQLGLKFIF